ncbi:MAG: chemotaxis protein CheA [Nannocystaceae bacterium]|nr:chemotaxis protein CheA [bacterium]
MSDPPKPSAEFLSEAQEVIEAFSRNLLQLDAQQRTGEYDPDLLNAAFRAIHSLKGLAGLFGASRVSALAHALESTLDSLRLGRLPLSQPALDVLFEAVEVFQSMLAVFGTEDAETVSTDALLSRITALSPDAEDGGEGSDLVGLDPAILGVLTEYEEHRLRENVRLGRRLFRVHAAFDLLAIDVGIESLKGKLKEFGEVITYLPSADSGSDDRIELDILLGSDATLADIATGVAEDGVRVFALETSAAIPETPAPATVADVAPTPTPTPAPVHDDVDMVDASTAMSLRSISQTVRVDLERLDVLMNLVGELALVQANLSGTLESVRAIRGAADVSRELQTHLRTMDRKLSLLQQSILDVRMVPLGQVFDKLARVVRKLGREAGKDIRLVITGAETELDKLIVEELSDPLMHMIRNCIDHGIETETERTSLGKGATGHIELRAFQKGNRVVIEVEDDGRGMDWRLIRDKAVLRGLIDDLESREMSRQEVIDLIFVPGFSTKDTATEVSGRGVGMDVVKTNIARLSGLIDVDTTPGRGSKFSITLPVTLAIIQALVIQTAKQTFCIPLNSVLESIMVSEADIETVEGHEVVSLRGKTLPILHLSRIFGLQTNYRYLDPARIYVVIVGLAQHRVGIVVDELLGQQDVVIKPLGRALRGVPGIAGATELGGGRTVLLLDVSVLVEEALGRSDATPTDPTPMEAANA